MSGDRYTWADLPDSQRVVIAAVTTAGTVCISADALRNLGWTARNLPGEVVLRSGNRRPCVATASPSGLRVAVPAEVCQWAGARFEARLR